MSIITYPLNGITYHAEDAEQYLCTRTSGIFGADSFGFEITDDMEVTIGKGQAWINNDEFKGKSVTVTEAEAITIPTANATLPRIDRIVLEFSTAINGSVIKLVQGTAAAEPVAPAIVQTATQYQLGLYTVRVNAAVTEMQDRFITDTRLDESVCGIMRDPVDKLPTDAIAAQLVDDIRNIVDTIRGILDEETASNLLLLIDEKLTAPSTATALPASGTALTANTIYTVSAPVGAYQFSAPPSGEAHGTFTTGSTVNITFASGAKFMLSAPTFDANQMYEFDVLDGVWAFCKVT